MPTTRQRSAKIGRIGGFGIAALGLALVVAPLLLTSAADWASLWDGSLRGAIWRSLASSLLSTVIAMSVGLRVGTWLASDRVPALVRVGIDLPLILPPIVVGFGLLALFRGPLRPVDDGLGIVAEPLAIVVAQTTIALSLAARMCEAAIAASPSRPADVLRTLGVSEMDAWRLATRNEARRGLLAAAVVVWAQTFGSFGPVLVLAGVTAGRTDVLPTAIYLDLSSGEIGRAAVTAAAMAAIATVVTTTMSRLRNRTADR